MAFASRGGGNEPAELGPELSDVFTNVRESFILDSFCGHAELILT